MIDKDDLNQNESMMDLEIDDKKVSDVAKTFDKDAAINRTMTLMSERKKNRDERIKNRNVHSIGMRLFDPPKDDTGEHYTSYDDHIKLLDKEIEDQKALILRCIERLELLIEKEALIMEEANAMTQESFQLPKQYKTDDEFFDSLVKEHILHKHPKVIGDYFGEYRFSSHAGTIHFEYIYNKEGKLVKVRCMDCYRKWLLNNSNGCPSKDDGEMTTYDKVGGKS